MKMRLFWGVGSRAVLLRAEPSFPPLVKGGRGGVETHSPDSAPLSPSLASGSRQSMRMPKKRLKITVLFCRKTTCEFQGLRPHPP